jgi:YbbR domain-containing protein
MMRITKNIFTDNVSYKLISLFIALILWITILGRRDFTVTRSMEVDIAVETHLSLLTQNVDHVKVKVVGPRTALRRFMDSETAQVISLDLSSYQQGVYEVDIPFNKIDVPFGVKVLSLNPNRIQVRIGKKE